jgi:hypothetical protein
LNQTHWSFVEEIEECEVDMAIEIGVEAHVNTANSQQERADNREIKSTKTT